MQSILTITVDAAIVLAAITAKLPAFFVPTDALTAAFIMVVAAVAKTTNARVDSTTVTITTVTAAVATAIVAVRTSYSHSNAITFTIVIIALD